MTDNKGKITVYTKDNCPACVIMKQKLKDSDLEFSEVNIGRDISVDDFMAKYPQVKAVPHVVIE